MDNFVTRGGRPKRGPQTSLESRLAGHTLGIDFDREIRLPPKRARRSYRPSKETMSPRIHRNLIISYRELSQQERECNFDISLQENLPPPNTLSLYNSLNFVPSIAIPLREESGEKICIVIGPRYVYIPPPPSRLDSVDSSLPPNGSARLQASTYRPPVVECIFFDEFSAGGWRPSAD